MVKEWTFISALVLANVLLAMSFYFFAEHFWIVFPISLAILSLVSLHFRLFTWRTLSMKTALIALIYSLVLYLLFSFGKWLIFFFSLPFVHQLESLYALVKPEQWWHFTFLFLLIIPGEELFWRGYVLEKLAMTFSKYTSIFLAAFLYGLAHIFSGSLLLVIAGIIAGVAWGFLSIHYRNITVAVVSHLVFDLLLLIVFPLI